MAQDPTPPLTPARLAALRQIPFADVPSPGYVVHLGRLEENCQLLNKVQEDSGAKILLALKGFACHATFPLVARYLKGITASGLHEALLGRDFFDGEVHVYAPAFKAEEVTQLGGFAHSLVFNSLRQWQMHKDALPAQVEAGLRVNPEHSDVEVDLYNPCSPCSRLGITRASLDAQQRELGLADLSALDGLHLHALCEQDADALENVVRAFGEKFGDIAHGRRWLNFGGGHHITRPGYDLERLTRVVRQAYADYAPQAVYLEPGEAVALHTGVLVVTVLDIIENGGVQLAILDTSATCHMPDVLEMPYRPNVLDAELPGKLPHTYRLGGLSCLAGDVIGDYSFAAPLQIGQRLVFLDMSHYTMVKTTTFNGVPLPSINTYDPVTDKLDTVRRFGYPEYRDRLS